MKKFILGLIVGIALVPGLVYLYLRSGRAPAAASDLPMPFERTIARMALHVRIDKEMPTVVPLPADETTFLAGVRVYRDNCAMCHGLPGQPAPAAAVGMFPQAPQLFQPHHMVDDDPPGETYWKAKNGIRLSGMPGFARSLSDQQLWQVSLLLANADKLPATVHEALTASPASVSPANPPK
jgi:mono/diheme cytochrome c family protein